MDKDEREWMMRFCDFQAFLAVDKSPEAFPRTAPAIAVYWGDDLPCTSAEMQTDIANCIKLPN